MVLDAPQSHGPVTPDRHIVQLKAMVKAAASTFPGTDADPLHSRPTTLDSRPSTMGSLLPGAGGMNSSDARVIAWRSNVQSEFPERMPTRERGSSLLGDIPRLLGPGSDQYKQEITAADETRRTSANRNYMAPAPRAAYGAVEPFSVLSLHDVSFGLPTRPKSDFTAAVAAIRSSIIGRGETFTSPYGRPPMVYADFAASGRLLRSVEEMLAHDVYPWYANVHTDTGECARRTGAWFEGARDAVADCCSAPRSEFAVLFCGNGMTGAAAKAAHLLGLKPQERQASARGWRRSAVPSLKSRLTSVLKPQRGRMNSGKPVVIFSVLEHHSNCVFWRDLDCITECIHEDAAGHPDLRELEAVLVKHRRAPFILGSFTAGSNVTGIAPPIYQIARLLHKHGAYAAFDFASAASSLRVDCGGEAGAKGPASPDIVFLSPHKLLGGPGSCGVLVIRRSMIRNLTPQVAGGGTVTFVNFTRACFDENVEVREDAGSPNVIAVVRSAIALELQARLTPEAIHAAGDYFARRAITAWRATPGLYLVGEDRPGYDCPGRLPVVSFYVLVKDPVDRAGLSGTGAKVLGRKALPAAGGGHKMLHSTFIAQLLNDVYGIQARAGCACAGPYGWILLPKPLEDYCGFKPEHFALLDEIGTDGCLWSKPGWCRVYFSYTMTEEEVDYIIAAVAEVARNAWKLLPQYEMDADGLAFKHTSMVAKKGSAGAACTSAGCGPCGTGAGGGHGGDPEAAVERRELLRQASSRITMPLAHAYSQKDSSPTILASLHGSGEGMGPGGDIAGGIDDSPGGPGGGAAGLTRADSSIFDTVATGALEALDSEARLNALCRRQLRVARKAFQSATVREAGRAALSPAMRAYGASAGAMTKAYEYCVRCPARWFLLPHEAADAVHRGMDLTLTERPKVH